jgi:hypothetical protein
MRSPKSVSTLPTEFDTGGDEDGKEDQIHADPVRKG